MVVTILQLLSVNSQLILVVCHGLNVLVAKLASSEERLDKEVDVTFRPLHRADEADKALAASCLENDSLLIQTVEVD